MTKDEALKLALGALEELDGIDTETECVTFDVGDAIAAIKEALAQRTEQEPVAWMVKGELYKTQQFHLEGGAYANQIPLYATPPQREWVGLTDEEITTTWKKWIGTERANKSYTLAIEATLRIKNT